MGHRVNSPHRRADAKDDLEKGWSKCRWKVGSLVKRNLKNRSLLCWWAMLVPRNGTEFPWIAKRVAKFIDKLGHNRVTFRCDNESAIEALARELAQGRQEGSQVLKRQPAGASHSNWLIERAVGLVAGQTRTLKTALEHRIGARVPPDARILCWLVDFAAYLMNRCDIGSDGKTPMQLKDTRQRNQEREPY